MLVVYPRIERLCGRSDWVDPRINQGRIERFNESGDEAPHYARIDKARLETDAESPIDSFDPFD